MSVYKNRKMWHTVVLLTDKNSTGGWTVKNDVKKDAIISLYLILLSRLIEMTQAQGLFFFFFFFPNCSLPFFLTNSNHFLSNWSPSSYRQNNTQLIYNTDNTAIFLIRALNFRILVLIVWVLGRSSSNDVRVPRFSF